MSQGIHSKAFIEAMKSEDVEPTERGCYDFDWETMEAAFGEHPLTDHEAERLALAISFLLDWLLDVELTNPKALKTVGKRAVAMAWVIDPKRFDSASLRKLAKSLGFTAPNIAPVTAEFSRLTNIFNKFQDHDWRKESNEQQKKKPDHKRAEGVGKTEANN